MKKTFTFINIREILQKEKEILKADPNNKWVFIGLPLLLGILCSLLFYNDTKAILGILTLFLWHCPRFCVNRKLEDSSFILESCFQI